MGTQNSKLNPQTLEDLKNCSGYSSEELQDWHKSFLKDHPSGYVGVAQFEDIYHKLFPSGDASKFAEHVFRAFDKNGDGRIEFREFVAASRVLVQGSTDVKLTWAFTIYDPDGNGYITRDDMLEIVKAIHKMVGTVKTLNKEDLTLESRTNMIFRKLDKNADGKISLEEFIRGAKYDRQLVCFLQARAC